MMSTNGGSAQVGELVGADVVGENEVGVVGAAVGEEEEGALEG
jgi:hypothetical protein